VEERSNRLGYYMGDYYAGARGDPGFFGSLLGKVTSLASSFVPGGSIVKMGIGAATAGIMKKGAGKVMGGIAKHPVLTAAGAAGAIGLGGGALAEHMMGGAGGCPRGHHISRSKHSKRFGQCVRNHMNVCNPRALRRSIRRAHGFAKFAMKCIHLTQPKKKGRFGGFKRKRRK